MIAPPNLPTDNLYKFMALAGVSIVVLSTVLFSIQLSAMSEKTDQLTLEIASLEAETKNLEADVDRAERAPTRDTQLLRQRHSELAVQMAVMGARNAVLRRVTANTGRSQTLMVIGWLVGMLIAAVGFVLWYTRVQTFQDQILRAQAKQP